MEILRYENFTAQEANRIFAIIFSRITYPRIFAVFVFELPAKTITYCFKCGTECCTLKMCVLTEIASAIGLNNLGAWLQLLALHL